MDPITAQPGASVDTVGPIRRTASAPGQAPTARPSDAWSSADPLGDALHHLRMDGVFYGLSEFSEPWGLDLPAMPECIMFHVVTAGECVLLSQGNDPLTLRPGMFTLVPHGQGHALASAPDAELTDLFDTTRYRITDCYERMVHGGGGKACRMICGAVRLDHPAARRLVKLLPEQMSIDTWNAPQTEPIEATLRLMAAEVTSPRPGGEAIITRLADMLVIQSIRAWLADSPSAKTGWLGALQDAQIGKALQRVHADPEQPWTVESLAEEAAMSRSAFSNRFRELVGETPMQYVRAWKMHIAAALLKDEGATVAELAYRFSYDSEAAFSRAFKRVMGVAPGAVKRSV